MVGTTRHFLALTLVAALVATGCVTQPVDETAFGLDEDLGATAAPLDPSEAERVATDALELRRQHARKNENLDEVVWTSRKRRQRDGGTGGLVRASEPPDDATRTRADESRERDRSGGDGGGDNTGTNGGDGDNTGTGGGDNTTGTKPPPSPPPPTFAALATVGDAEGDASGKSPAYADIRQLLIESNGTRARVTVTVTGRIPSALEEGEIQGMGVDFYRSDETESDYQLFATGEADGWQAFLHTPDGIVQFPGSFSVGGRVFVFEVPWSALGGRKRADVGMFIDWSRRETPLNASGNDRAPNKGRVAVDPR